MTFATGYWIRTVTQTRTVVEVFKSSAGKPEYVEKDGAKAMSIQQGETSVAVTEPFRRLTAIEQALLEASTPELWKDSTDD